MTDRREFLTTTTRGIVGATLATRAITGTCSQTSQPRSSPSVSRTRLCEVLERSGKPVETVGQPDGTTVVLLPYGGRVLGVYSPASEENFYWTNPALETVSSAKEFFGSDQWQNTGGDRTWLAPEIDFFFPDYPKLDRYVQPRQLDPGHYEVEKAGGNVRLVNHLSATLSRSGVKVDLKITKSVGPAPNPLRYEKDNLFEGLEYAGYTQYTSLEMLGDSSSREAQVGLWNLVQMPHGGDMLIPTYSRCEPRIYFGEIPQGDLIVDDHRVLFRMRGKGEYKLGVRSVATTGRVGYLYSDGSRWSLIIRNFYVNPSGEYVDVPWKEPDDRGYSTQACNVNSGLGSFSELEYHIPAIGQGTGRERCDDTAQVWAFRGTQEQMFRVVRSLLSPKGT